MNRTLLNHKLATLTHRNDPVSADTHFAASAYRMIRRSRVKLVMLLKRIIANLSLWRARSRQRRQLAEMSPHMLNDIGLSRYDAMQEYEKPFWRE